MLAFLAAAVLFMTTLKFLPRSYHNFVIGKSIKNDFLNLLIILIGGSQKKLPSKTFVRILLMLFVMFCLIMRSLYTGSFYKLLKSDIYSRRIKSISDLVDHEFDFYTYPSLAERIKDEYFMKR